MDENPLAERGRSLENEYFRKKDQELIERIRRERAAQEARQQLSATSGLQDPALIDELEALGFTTDTVALLPLVPLIQVAWAEGGVTAAERALVVKLARARGIGEGSAADQTLDGWLANRPSPDVFARATRLLGAMLQSPQTDAPMTAADLVKYCEEIAASSGGVFGINKISGEERALLAAIASALAQPRK